MDPNQVEISIEDPVQADIVQLLEAHLVDMRAVSPPGSIHALEIEELRRPDITFWAARLRHELLGCGALLELSPTEGEVKAMRTARSVRRQGVGAAVLETIVAEALRRGYQRLNLETGSQDFFTRAHRLYAGHGFDVCGPFGSYRDDPNSIFMTRRLPQTR